MSHPIQRSHNGSTFERSLSRRADYQWTCITTPRAATFWEERGRTARPDYPFYTYTGSSMRIYFRTFEAAVEKCQKYARHRYERDLRDAVTYCPDLLPMLQQAMADLPEYEPPQVTLYWPRKDQLARAQALWPQHKHLLRPSMPKVAE